MACKFCDMDMLDRYSRMYCMKISRGSLNRRFSSILREPLNSPTTWNSMEQKEIHNMQYLKRLPVMTVVDDRGALLLSDSGSADS